MTSAHKRWTAEHQRMLQQARADAGLNDAAFARDNTITLRQLQQLEQGGSSAFYSESIQYDKGVQLLKRLGVASSDWPALSAARPELTTPVAATAAPSVDLNAVAKSAPAPAQDSSDNVSTRHGRLVWFIIGVGLLGAGVMLSMWPDAVPTTTATMTHPEPPATRSSEPPVEAAMSPTPRTESPEPVADPGCELQDKPVTVAPSHPTKPADYVYLVAVSDVTVCVQDASGQRTRLSLPAGQSLNVPGRQPFELTADKLSQLQVFFQGQRVSYASDATGLRLQANVTRD